MIAKARRKSIDTSASGGEHLQHVQEKSDIFKFGAKLYSTTTSDSKGRA